MRRVLWTALAVMLLLLFLSPAARAAELDTFDEDIRRVEDSIDGDTAGALDSLGAAGVEDVISRGVDGAAVFRWLGELIADSAGGPMAALTMLTAVILITALGESYTYSLRYTNTREVMGAVVSLFIASAVITPVTALISSAATVIGSASAVMTVYLPVMAGMMAFSGHVISSAGYYAAVVTVSGLLSRVASSLLVPLMNILLSLSLSAGIGSRLNLSGLTEMLSKCFKYTLTFLMSMYVAVIGLNSALSAAGDTLTGRAAKLSLSSFVPLIGASVAEAYGAIQGSVNILRSGVGVFVILAVFVSFAPVLIRALLWSLALGAAKAEAEVLGVSAASAAFQALSAFMTMLRALLICVMTAFVISTAVMLRVGGGA